MKTVCKILRNFTVQILRKREITIDFNGPRGQLHHSITQKRKHESFLKFDQVIPLIIVDNLHYRLFHSVM